MVLGDTKHRKNDFLEPRGKLLQLEDPEITNTCDNKIWKKDDIHQIKEKETRTINEGRLYRI